MSFGPRLPTLDSRLLASARCAASFRRWLSPPLKEALLLVYFQGMKYEQAAHVMKIPVGTVKSRLNRARNAFAEIIEPALR